MENREGIEKLYFELASESRLDLLRELNEKNWKMNDVARKLDLTTTETYRQLQRLTEAKLVERQPDGSYAISEYGKLVLHLSSPLEFIFKHKEYFSAHDIWRLPPQLLSRLGELSQAELKMGMVESTTKSSTLIGEAEKFMWAVSAEPLPISLEETAKQIPSGLEYRVLSPLPPAKLPNLENRTLLDPPVMMAVTEKEAVVCFRFKGGRMDYAGFFGKNSSFLNWTKDLFLHCWEKGKRF